MWSTALTTVPSITLLLHWIQSACYSCHIVSWKVSQILSFSVRTYTHLSGFPTYAFIFQIIHYPWNFVQQRKCVSQKNSLCISTMQFNLIGLFYTVTIASKIKWTVHPCGRKVSWIVPWKLNLRWVCELRKLARSWLMELLRVPTSRLHSQFGSLQLMLI